MSARKPSLPIICGSVLYALLLWLSTFVLGTLLLLSFWMPFSWRYQYARCWSVLNLTTLKYACGLRYSITGREHLPQTPSVLMVKHQSAYEILVLVRECPPLAWVAKRELLSLPFFGWSFALLKPIAIKREAGSQSIKQLLTQGTASLAAGRSVLIFPEGTRVAPGVAARYHPGGAKLAQEYGCAMVPITHNSGAYWPRQSFLKYPGTVQIVIGEAIVPDAQNPQTPKQLTQQVKQWIDAQGQGFGC